MIDLLLDNIWTILGIVLGSGFLGVGFWKLIEKFSGKGSVIFRELSEAFGSGADFLEKLNKEIEDDGKLDANEIKDLLKAGKVVIKEFKDVIIEIKPKKIT